MFLPATSVSWSCPSSLSDVLSCFFHQRNILLLQFSTPFFSFLPPHAILQLQSVSVSMEVIRSSINTNLNFILSHGSYSEHKSQRLHLSLTVYSWQGLWPVFCLFALPIMPQKNIMSNIRSVGRRGNSTCMVVVSILMKAFRANRSTAENKTQCLMSLSLFNGCKPSAHHIVSSFLS